MCRRPISIAILTVALTLLATAAAPAAGVPRWRLVAHTGVPDLFAVDALSASSVWAVGSSNNRSSNGQPVAVRWDGRKLRTWSFPWKGDLRGVEAVSENDIWAVGDAADAPLAVHFDGRSWRRVSLPAVANGSLADVTATAPGDVWAVGDVSGRASADRPLVMRFDGRRWRIVGTGTAAPRPARLTSVAGASAGDVWAVGVTGPHLGGAGFGPVVLRWHGRRWTRVSTPIGNGDYQGGSFGALDVAPSGEVWTVVGDTFGGDCCQFLRWSGPGRNILTFYEPGFPGTNSSVFDIAAVSKAGVWAVGGDYNAASDGIPFVAYGNGKSWQNVSTPFSQLKDTWLYAISALSPTEVWAVGENLIARYSS